MTKETLDIYEFGKQLINSRDLDPTYVVLWKAKWDHAKLCNFLLAYWCFYHFGTASWIADVGDRHQYWSRFKQAAASKDWPRSSERRHFRGQQAIKATEELAALPYSPSELIGRIAYGPTPDMSVAMRPTLSDVMNRAKQLRGFGDWIGFKVADMIERLGIAQVDFQPTDVFHMFESPRIGAADMAAQEHKQFSNENDCCTWAYKNIHRKLGTLKAPPRFERRINIQEIETILCKFHSHVSGHYTIGKDIKEVKHGLELFKNRSKLAVQLLKAGSVGKLW